MVKSTFLDIEIVRKLLFYFAVYTYSWIFFKSTHTISGLFKSTISGLPVSQQYMEFFYRRVWRYQRSNQNPYIEEEQKPQLPKEKVQKNKQRSTKHTYETNDRARRTPLKTGGEFRYSGRISSSCSTSDILSANLVYGPVCHPQNVICTELKYTIHGGEIRNNKLNSKHDGFIFLFNVIYLWKYYNYIAYKEKIL